MKLRPKLEAHVFVCTNVKEKGESCGPKGGKELRDDLKDRCSKRFGKRVRVNVSGCLGRCEEGIVCVIYPEGKWFTELKPKERHAERIEEEVARLLDENDSDGG